MKPNIEIWDTEKLIPYEQNVKIHDEKQVSKIAESIREFGWTQPIVVDRKGVIIAGHGRRLAAQKLGYDKVPVWVRDDLDEAQVRALRLADNRVAEGKIDTEMFRQELASLDFDLTGMFEAKELEFSVADLGSISLGAFIDDVSGAVDAQGDRTRELAKETSEKPVAVHKVLGFKEIPGPQQISVSRFMAHVEQVTGLTGAAAFVAYAEKVVSNG